LKNRSPIAASVAALNLAAVRRTTLWALALVCAVAVAWIVTPGGPSFARLPGGGGLMTPWIYTNLNGQAVASSQFTNKVLVLNYWATFCPPCLDEIPALKSFYKDYHSRGVELIGIAMDEEGARLVAPFVKAHDINYPIVLGIQDIAPPMFPQPIPRALIVDRQGRIAARYAGALTREELDKVVAPLLEGSAGASNAPTATQ
jgi:thiol-disulfide isomerase/thioredoxin